MPLKIVATVISLAGISLAQQYPDCVNGPLANNTVCDTSASVAERAQALVAELTPAEKFNLTGK